jgi:predicted DNA-binding transcriptional regulator AlpA
MTRAELLSLPASIDLLTAARALGIGRTTAYQLARAGEFPVKVLRLGTRYRVATSALLVVLHIDPASPGATIAPHGLNGDRLPPVLPLGEAACG